MKRFSHFWGFLALFAGGLFALYSGTRPYLSPATAAPLTTYATTITVDSSRDVTTSLSERCDTHTPCTLRRAIVQARLLAPAARPVLIQFSIPITDVGYVPALHLWELEVKSTADPAVFRAIEGGQVTIDGSTQPNGRLSGPKIVLVGASTGNKNGLIVGVNATGAHDGNVVRGLGFQNFKDHITVNSNNNLLENNWFGLTSDGTAVYLRANNPEDGSGSSGIAFTSGNTGNIVQHNVFLGFDGVAAAVRGNGNIFRQNWVGTNASGLVPAKQTDPSLLCTTVDWLGGGGLSLDGPDHLIEDNVIAGLRQEIFISSSQPDAIWVQSTCDNCIIQNNQIGLDEGGNEIGVCGIGFDLTNTEGVQVLDNLFAETYHSALFLNGAMYDANTLRGNLIRRSTPWLVPEDSPKADDAILRFTGLPDPLELFNPAAVTLIEGTAIQGTAGENSPCPNCVVELFLDDTDSINEALQSLAVVTAGADGTWTAVIPAPLTNGQGIRTTSTTAQFNTISNISAGTTVGLSRLYVSGYEIYLPLVVK